MNKEPEGAIIFFINSGELTVELVKDIKVDTIRVVDAESPQGKGLMDKLGKDLRNGPIVCKNVKDVERLTARIYESEPLELTVMDDLMSACRDITGRFDVFPSGDEVCEVLDRLPRFTQIPCRHQINGHPNKPGREGKGRKMSRHHMYGKRK